MRLSEIKSKILFDQITCEIILSFINIFIQTIYRGKVLNIDLSQKVFGPR
jgi:hypothetical protein